MAFGLSNITYVNIARGVVRLTCPAWAEIATVKMESVFCVL